MLHLDVLDSNGRPIVLQASRVIIRDSATKTPIAVATEYAPGSFMAASAADPDFENLLKILRINDTVVVHHCGPDDLPRISI